MTNGRTAVTAPSLRGTGVPIPRSGPGSGAWFLARANLSVLIDLLHEDGRTVIGPTVRDGTIMYDEIRGIEDLPAGLGDEHRPGHYELQDRGDGRLFGYTVGPAGPKRWTFPPLVPLTVGRRDGRSVTFEPAPVDSPSLAFLGVRACELAALGIQDRVFLGGPYTDDDYRARRRAALLIAVNCSTASSTCFCTSMGTGPEVRSGYDIVLTELDEGFVVRAGSPEGAALVAHLPVRAADAAQIERAAESVDRVATMIGDPVPTEGLHDRLLAQFDSPRWAQIAERCLSCANCTLVCPTCFCSSVVQRSDLDGTTSTSERIWDTCFTAGFARVAGGNFRSRPRDRYRQWLTHKFATWIDQFGTTGCVGCGRCITWCPVGIDVRAELLAIAPPLAVQPETAPLRPAAATTKEFTTGRIRAVRSETADVTTLTVGDVDPAFLAGRFGQFAMLALPSFPPLPISISRYRRDAIDLTIRAAGPATATLVELGPGDEIGLRGPLGEPWPIERAVGHDVVIVTGGIGLAPLRPLIDGVLAQRDRFDAVRLYYGARTADDQLYREELRGWAARGDIDVQLTVDRAGPEWAGPVGVVTHLFDRATWDGSRSLAFVCGPERMMEATAEALADHGLTPDRIFFTLERHMECGIGLCGHCQVGKLFVCRDGPVFSLAQLGDVLGREGI
ncbi:MAG TPA: 4Fe-4S dicluster domain-containing protein [Candidatus Limnocylindrales bacterium]|nr:4Fe-4S dicluster domain-containing protein [Candidatus Limnocylindrales bacterium]